MISFKKILLLLVIAALAYAFWPRPSSLATFRPAEIADLETNAWKQAAGKNWFAHAVAGYRIYSGQFGFTPVAALRTTIEKSRAVAMFQSAADPSDKEAAGKPLTQSMVLLKAQVKGSFDPAAVSAATLAYWRSIDTGTPEEAAAAKAAQLAALYGGTPRPYLPAAREFVRARSAAKNSDWPAVRTALTKAWSSLQAALKSR